jgi:hypothetical protein
MEMPHLMLDTGEFIDLELEVHSNMTEREYLDYFRDWLSGRPMKSKNPGFTQRLTKQGVKDFVNYIINNTVVVREFTKKHYGNTTWRKLVKILLKHA